MNRLKLIYSYYYYFFINLLIINYIIINYKFIPIVLSDFKNL